VASLAVTAGYPAGAGYPLDGLGHARVGTE
jgi:hypothetical protein